MANYRIPTLNKVLMVGSLTRDPQLRFTGAGVSVCNFRIASNRRYKDPSGEWREEVCYVGVVAWQKLAESCSQMLKRGSVVLVEGELQSKSLETQNGETRSIVEIRAFRMQFLDRRPDQPDANGELSEAVDLLGE